MADRLTERSNPPLRDPLQEPAWLRALLIGAAVLSMALLVVLPLAMVLASAFGDGFRAWWAALAEPDAHIGKSHPGSGSEGFFRLLLPSVTGRQNEFRSLSANIS